MFQIVENPWEHLKRPPKLHRMSQNVQESFKATQTLWERFKMRFNYPERQRTLKKLKWIFLNLHKCLRSLRNIRWNFWMFRCLLKTSQNPWKRLRLPKHTPKKCLRTPKKASENKDNFKVCLWTFLNLSDPLGIHKIASDNVLYGRECLGTFWNVSKQFRTIVNAWDHVRSLQNVRKTSEHSHAF